MAEKVGSLVVEMSANVARLQRDFNNASRQATGVAKKFKSIFKGVGLSIAAGLSVAGVTKLVRGSLNAADKVAKLSQSVGVSVEQLSSFSHAATLAGTDLGTVAKGLGLLSKNMMDAAGGTGEAKNAFAALGIEVKSTDGTLKNSDTVLAEVADRFAVMENGAGKTALAMKMFGRSGADLIPLLNNGAEGLAKMREEAGSLGIVFTTETAQAAERVNDNFARMKAATYGLANSLTAGMLPTLENLTNMMASVRTQSDGVSIASSALSAGLKLVASAALIVAEAFKTVGSSLGAVFAAIAEAMSGNFSNALTILKISFTDTVDGIKGTVDTLGNIWDDAASRATANAPATGQKLAAPIIEAAKAVGKAGKEAKKAGTEYVDALAKRAADIYQATRTAKEKFTEQVAEIDNLLNIGRIDPETYRRAYAQMAEEYKDAVDGMKGKTDTLAGTLSDAAAGLGMSFSSALEDAIIKAKDFGDILSGLAEDITRILVRKSVTEPLANWASSFASGLFQGASTAGGKAVGGPVSAGRSFLVGEAGPEIFMPQTAGSIIPSSRLGGEGGVSESPNYNIFIQAADAKSFSDMCKRNPQAVIAPFEESLRLGNKGLRSSLQTAR